MPGPVPIVTWTLDPWMIALIVVLALGAGLAVAEMVSAAVER